MLKSGQRDGTLLYWQMEEFEAVPTWKNIAKGCVLG